MEGLMNRKTILVLILLACGMHQLAWAPAEEQKIASGDMLGPLYLKDGTPTVPGLGFISERGTGLFLTKAGTMALAIDGTGEIITIDSTSVTYNVSMTFNYDAAPTFDATGFSPQMIATTWDFTGSTNVAVPTATAGTHAMNRDTCDARYGILYASNYWDASQNFNYNVIVSGQVRAADGTKTAPGIAFNDGGGVYDTGIRNTASKGLSNLLVVVNDTDVLNINQDLTIFNDLWVDGSATFGTSPSGHSMLFRGMDSWTSQSGPSAFTWNLDLPTTFDNVGYAWTMLTDTATMTANLVDFTGSTDFTVPDANAATEAVNIQVGDARYALSGSFKSGTVAGASFAGNPKIYTVTFNTAFPDTNYSVSVISEESRNWTFQSKLAGSFVMNSNANLALALNVDWIAMAHNDP